MAQIRLFVFTVAFLGIGALGFWEMYMLLLRTWTAAPVITNSMYWFAFGGLFFQAVCFVLGGACLWEIHRALTKSKLSM